MEADISYLLEAEQELARIKRQKVQLEQEYEQIRAVIFETFDTVYGPNRAIRHHNPDSDYIIAREYSPSEPTPKIDWNKIVEALTPEQRELAGTMVWVGDEEKLVKAIDSGKIPKQVLDDAVSYLEPAARLNYRSLSKAEQDLDQNRWTMVSRLKKTG